MPDLFPQPLTDELLDLLDDLRPGDWLAVASANAPLLERTRSLTLPSTLEQAAAAVFAVLPISRHTRVPLASWAVDAADPVFQDLVHAVQGLASDGSGRRQRAHPLPDDVLVECIGSQVRSTIRVPWEGAPFLFLICAGGGIHQPTDLQHPRVLAGSR